MITLEQRISKLESLFSKLISDVKSDIRVSLPAKVISFDKEKQTISCIPTVRELVNINGQVKYVDLPVLEDVPIQMPRAGGWIITLPIKPGDECMVIFQDLCIDGWWFRGDIQNWNDLRRHDFSDAIATFSPWSQPNVISNYFEDGIELRSVDGSTKITIESGKISILGDLEVTGKISASDTITSDVDVIAGTISGKTHKHTGVQTGSGNTGGPL